MGLDDLKALTRKQLAHQQPNLRVVINYKYRQHVFLNRTSPFYILGQNNRECKVARGVTRSPGVASDRWSSGVF